MKKLLFMLLMPCASYSMQKSINMHDAVLYNYYDIVLDSVDSKIIDVNMVDSFGNTLLHKATTLGIAELLIENGADITKVDYEGNSVLHSAVKHGNIGVVELFLERGIDVNSRNDKKTTPLHIAVINDDLKMAEFLIKNKADVDAMDKFGFTALHFAVFKGSFGMVSLLLENEADMKVNQINGKSLKQLTANKLIKDLLWTYSED